MRYRSFVTFRTMAEPPEPSPLEARPVLVYDGDCGFCRRWVARWALATGDTVEYVRYREAGERFAGLSLEEVRRSVQLVDPDGTVHRGAEAVFRVLAHGPGFGGGWKLWCYRKLPGVAPITEWGYRFVAKHRIGFSKLCDLLWGRQLGPSSYVLSRTVFLRLLGVVYLIAFVSLWTQVEGLAGSNGIFPAGNYLEAVGQRWGRAAAWRAPTLCWLDSSDGMLNGLCAAGTVLSLLLIGGVAPPASLFLLWAAYLSISIVVQPFLSFQWDILLLEAGFLAMFLAPARLWSRPSRERTPLACGIWLERWLLFKLMFLSGVTKLLSGDPTWRDLTALDYHYETQPIPTATSWYVHQLPSWFQKMSVVGMFVIECGVPFLIFAPRRLRHLGAAAMIGFQVMIAATGNYCFFNLLTIVLCVLLLDDRLLRRFVPRRWTGWLDEPRPPRSGPGWAGGVVVGSAVALVGVSILSFVDEMVATQRPGKLPAVVVGVLKAADVGLLSWGEPLLLRPIAPFRTINGYGLFRVMTTERPEIVIEGTDDGLRWEAYEFGWKVGDPKRRPRFVAPHQPRLDWQMWFAALSPQGNSYWLEGLMRRLLEGSPEVLDLLAEDGNPFPDQPPQFVRLLYYRYEFTDFAERRQTGAWWRRQRVAVLSQPVSLRMFERRRGQGSGVGGQEKGLRGEGRVEPVPTAPDR